MPKLLDFSAPVQAVTEALSAAGHQAWAVGGCIRDALLGQQPHDWDLATSATPPQAKAALGAAGIRTVDTGLRHGTVTALAGGQAVEVTTFRADGEYLDGRRPSQVTFSASITDDLARRDFTINAMAWDGHRLADPFGGQADLEAGVIRAVGDPRARFGEDGLRILRAMRFAARLGFSIETATAAAMHDQRDMLTKIAGERVRQELMGLLAGSAAPRVLRAYAGILEVILPEIIPCVGFDQRNHHHIYDVWEHTLHAVEAASPDPVLRLVLLLHDFGKPLCLALDAQGSGHFYGHGELSYRLAADILDRLRFDSATRDRVLRLIKYHDSDLLATPKSLRRWLMRLGREELALLVAVKEADNAAQNPRYSRRADLAAVERLLAQIPEDDCLTVGQLAVDGNDVLALGAPGGPAVGAVLDALLEAVVDERCANRREPLLALAASVIEEEQWKSI